MNIDQRIGALCDLGKVLRDFIRWKGEGTGDPGRSRFFSMIGEAILKASLENPWFTEENSLFAVSSIAETLTRENLEQWLSYYSDKTLRAGAPKNVAVIMAGNIPLVGFHDFLCTLIAGHRITGRLSSDDTVLLPALSNILTLLVPECAEKISFTTERLSGFDAVIATGSNNTSRYFEYYFGKYPHIIRKNRNAVGIITGNETREEMCGLEEDIFMYFGLGCRSVSKVYLPDNYDPAELFGHFTRFSSHVHHNKYCNNYEYNKSILMVNQVPYLDNGFLLMKEDPQLVSPVSVLFYEKYADKQDLYHQLSPFEDQLQVVVCREEIPFRSCLPGKAQVPGLADYADGIDTLDFLLSL
jgi:hypothetical protein